MTLKFSDDSWLILLLGQLRQKGHLAAYFSEDYLKTNGQEMSTIVEFLVDTVRSAEEQLFDQDLLYQMKELFFTLCNHVLIVKSDSLPFGVENSILLKNFFELFGSLSGRDRSGIRTEPMMVTVCGVAKAKFTQAILQYF